MRSILTAAVIGLYMRMRMRNALYGSAVVLVTITLWCVWYERMKHRQVRQGDEHSAANS